MSLVCSRPLRCLLHVPPDRLAPLLGALHQPAFLESGPGFGAAGRWSILAANPTATFIAQGNRWQTQFLPDGQRRAGGDPLRGLARFVAELGLADPADATDPNAPPFQGGLIGHIGYDLAPLIESLPRRVRRDSRLPDIRFALYETFATVDHLRGEVALWFCDVLGHGENHGHKMLEAARHWFEAANSEREVSPTVTAFAAPPRSELTRDEYLRGVERVLDYIAAGDTFQVNLSQRFVATGRIDPLDLYLRLKQRSPAPFAAFLRWDDLAVVSASPEWFYQTRGDHIITRPIKGTRPRGATSADDERLATELLASPKDRAELTMIVDLERNDFGRVCEYGSVRVVDPLRIESFAQVHHLVATVEGRLRPDLGPIDVVKAVFPGGSITGAPKIRAMQIIDELEPTRRSLYTGAIGYFSRGGTSAFNIAIRTMLVEGGRVSYQVGGGIVADSDPVAEYEETLHKGRGLREVIEGWRLQP